MLISTLVTTVESNLRVSS